MSFESLNPDRRPTRRALVRAFCSFGLALPMWLLAAPVSAQGPVLDEPHSENEAYDIQNPFALIPRLPVENQLDFDAGPDRDVMRYALRPRPVIPFRLSDDLALVTRTTFNVVYQEHGLSPGDSDEFGLGDTDMELFFTPRRVAAGGTLVYGGGPILRFDTTTNDALGSDKWGAGPTAVVVWQPARMDASSGWTFAFFANHLWGVANSDNDELDLTYLQPLASYTFETGLSLGLDTQSTYDWHNDDWTVPLNLTLSQSFELAGQAIVATVGGRYYAQQPEDGSHWGGQLSFNFLFGD